MHCIQQMITCPGWCRRGVVIGFQQAWWPTIVCWGGGGLPYLAAHLVPAPVFPRKPPAGRWSNTTPQTPGGQPVPPDPPATEATPPDHDHHGAGDRPSSRWARCPLDQHLHLLAPAQLAAADVQGHGRAGCGRLIPRAGLMIDGASVAGWCWDCLTGEPPNEPTDPATL